MNRHVGQISPSSFWPIAAAQRSRRSDGAARQRGRSTRDRGAGRDGGPGGELRLGPGPEGARRGRSAHAIRAAWHRAELCRAMFGLLVALHADVLGVA